MLKELTKGEWLKILNLPEARIPNVLILRGTRGFRSKYRAMLLYFDNVLHLARVPDVPRRAVRGSRQTARPVRFIAVLI